MKLSEMTIEQLKHKRDAIDKTLVNKSPIKVVKFEFDPGDDRTTGYFELEANTPSGVLAGGGSVNGDFGEEERELNGEELNGEEGEYPDLGLPQASEASGKHFKNRARILLIEALEQWYESYLQRHG